MGEVVSQQPPDGPGEGPDPDHEADRPADVHDRVLRVEPHGKRQGVLFGSGGPQDSGDYERRGAQDHAAGQSGEDVGVAQDPTWFAVLLRLWHIDRMHHLGCGAHSVFPPPISRTQESNSSWVTTLTSVSI